MSSADSSQSNQALGQAHSRRDFLWRSGGGLGGIALAGMLGRDGALATTEATRPPIGLHHAPKAKRVIQLFMGGAASHVDLFDFKPELIKRHGEKWDPGETVELFQSSPGKTFKSPWEWAQHGQCGKPLTSIVSELGECVDDMAFIHNVVGKTGVHSQATYLQATGFQRPGFPGMGAWVSYGLGSLNDNLPTFVVLPDHRGYASNGPKNWSSAFLPALHQGTTLFPGRANPIADLHPPKGSFVTAKSEAATQSLLSKFNREHAASREADSRLDARIKSYELAARMQLSAPAALDISPRTGAHQAPLRARPQRPDLAQGDQRDRGDRLLFPQVPSRPATTRARGTVHPDLVWQRQRISEAQLGFSRGHKARPRPAGPRHG